MTATNTRNPALQKGPAELPYSPAGLANIKAYDPERDGDYTGMCMPFGLMRSMNAPYPIQIMQNDKYVAFLFESQHLVPRRPVQDRAFQGLEPDVVRQLDRQVGRRHAGRRHDRLQRLHAARHRGPSAQRQAAPGADVQARRRRATWPTRSPSTIPVYYTKPWTNERTMTLSNGELLRVLVRGEQPSRCGKDASSCGFRPTQVRRVSRLKSRESTT